MAYASHCMLDMSDNYRPVAGFINICPSVSLLYGTPFVLNVTFICNRIGQNGYSRGPVAILAFMNYDISKFINNK